MVGLFILIILVSSSWCDDTFTAYDCQDVQNAEFYSHDLCNKHTDKLSKQQFTIVQKRSVAKIEGFTCHGLLTSTTGYCGRYSHNKFTGEDVYGKPMVFSHDECQKLATDQFYSISGQSFPLKMGGVTFFSIFIHGSVTYSGTNIACTGGEMRLSDGNLNTNMLRQNHYAISISPIELIQVDHELLDPYSQTSLGLFTYGYSHVDAKTYVWETDEPDCKLLKVMDLEMESARPDVWFNDRHAIQLTVVDTFYDQACKVKLSKTDAKDIFLTPVTTHLEKLSSINVDLSIDTQIRFEFVNTKLAEVLRYNYKNGLPVCSKIKDTSLASTSRSGEHTFVRNLGDTSVEFTCLKIDVAPVPDEKCFSMLRVQDLKSDIWFLDPETRILMKTAVEIPCAVASVPIYRNTKNELVSYSPDRKVVTSSPANLDDSSEFDGSQNGIYPAEMVRSWLDMDFLQHLARHSYSVLSHAICHNSECTSVHTTPDQLYGYMGSAVKNMQNTANSILSYGIDMEDVGRKCSVAVCIMVILYSSYSVITWFVRYALFKSEDIGCAALIIRATCPNLFLITKATKEPV